MDSTSFLCFYNLIQVEAKETTCTVCFMKWTMSFDEGQLSKHVETTEHLDNLVNALNDKLATEKSVPFIMDYRYLKIHKMVVYNVHSLYCQICTTKLAINDSNVLDVLMVTADQHIRTSPRHVQHMINRVHKMYDEGVFTDIYCAYSLTKLTNYNRNCDKSADNNYQKFANDVASSLDIINPFDPTVPRYTISSMPAPSISAWPSGTGRNPLVHGALSSNFNASGSTRSPHIHSVSNLMDFVKSSDFNRESMLPDAPFDTNLNRPMPRSYGANSENLPLVALKEQSHLDKVFYDLPKQTDANDKTTELLQTITSTENKVNVVSELSDFGILDKTFFDLAAETKKAVSDVQSNAKSISEEVSKRIDRNGFFNKSLNDFFIHTANVTLKETPMQNDLNDPRELVANSTTINNEIASICSDGLVPEFSYIAPRMAESHFPNYKMFANGVETLDVNNTNKVVNANECEPSSDCAEAQRKNVRTYSVDYLKSLGFNFPLDEDFFTKHEFDKRITLIDSLWGVSKKTFPQTLKKYNIYPFNERKLFCTHCNIFFFLYEIKKHLSSENHSVNEFKTLYEPEESEANDDRAIFTPQDNCLVEFYSKIRPFQTKYLAHLNEDIEILSECAHELAMEEYSPLCAALKTYVGSLRDKYVEWSNPSSKVHVGKPTQSVQPMKPERVDAAAYFDMDVHRMISSGDNTSLDFHDEGIRNIPGKGLICINCNAVLNSKEQCISHIDGKNHRRTVLRMRHEQGTRNYPRDLVDECNVEIFRKHNIALILDDQYYCQNCNRTFETQDECAEHIKTIAHLRQSIEPKITPSQYYQ